MMLNCAWQAEALLGEGALWDPRTGHLWWVDIKGREVHRLTPATGNRRSWRPGLRITALGLTDGSQLIAATDEGFALLNPETLALEPLHHPEPHLADNRFNDGKVDWQGRFWAGTMDDTETDATGSVYRLTGSKDCERLAADIMVPNGPAFAPDGRTAYVSNSALRTTYRWILDGDGTIREQAVFAIFDEGQGYPDGMTVDATGHVWIAFWDGWCVRRLDPQGRIVDEVRLPVQRPTSCVFAGPALDELYITSARVGLTSEELADQPLAGSLFHYTPGVSGVAPHRFAVT